MDIIYEPPVSQDPVRPRIPASNFREGTVVRMEDGSEWKVEWDYQDHRLQWFIKE